MAHSIRIECHVEDQYERIIQGGVSINIAISEL